MIEVLRPFVFYMKHTAYPINNINIE